jgi:short-subunit dehydrogenase
MQSQSPKLVLITGASSGLGAALAIEYAKRGARLALLARRTDRMQALADRLIAAGTMVSVHTADVTQDGEVARCVATLRAEGLCIDIVIANAGFSVAGKLQDLSLLDYRRQLETNVFGVLRTIYESIEALRASAGRLVIVSSVAGYAAAPGASAYAMSKFALRALAESLRGELRPQGIGVTLVTPGFVDSDIRRTDNHGQVFADYRDPIPRWLRMRSEKAARIMADGIDAGRAEVIVTLHAKLIIFLTRHCHRLVRWLSVHFVRWRKQAAARG